MASLRDELLALPGVAEAEVEGDGPSPSGLRIRLAPGADAERVGAEVQRLLAFRGMRSRVGPEEPPPAPVLPLVAAPPAVEAAAAAVAEPTAAALASVRVEERVSSLEVTVTAADGREVTRRAELSEEGLAAAVIEAVGVLLAGAPPRVIAVDWSLAEGLRVVTVVLEAAGGARGAGAGAVRASRAYAVARASWSALTP